MPSTAAAVPGVELLLPAAAASTQLLAALGITALRPRGRQLAWAVGTLLAWAVLGLSGALLFGLVTAGPRARLAALVLAALSFAHPPRVPPELSPWQPGATVVQIGEPEDHANCAVPGAVALRRADAGRLRGDETVYVADYQGPVAGSNRHPGDADDAVCQIPRGGWLLEALAPRRGLRPRLPNPGRWALGASPARRPVDVAHRPWIPSDRLVRAPSEQLPALVAGLPDGVIVGGRPHDVAAAARLAREHGRVLPATPLPFDVLRAGASAATPPPQRPLGPGGLLALLALVAIGAAAARRAVRRGRRLLVRSRSPAAPAVSTLLGALPWAVGLAGAAALAATPTTDALARLTTPAVWTTSTGPALAAAAALVLPALAARRRRDALGWLIPAAGALAMLAAWPAMARGFGWTTLELLPWIAAGLVALRPDVPVLAPPKAARLFWAQMAGAPTPPAWLYPVAAPPPGAGPWFVRSAAPDEDASTGQYASLASPPVPWDEALDAVLQAAGTALVLPFVPAEWSAVVRVDPWRVDVEWGDGHDAVTGGRGIRGALRIDRTAGTERLDGDPLPGRSALLRWSRRLATPTAHLEWVGRGGAAWLVQVHPLPEGPRRALAEQLPHGPPPVRATDGLPAAASARTTELWAEVYAQAWPRALRALGVPGAASPPRPAVAAGGALFLDPVALSETARALRLRSLLPGWAPRRLAAQQLRWPEAPGPDDLVAFTARSLALRWLEHWLRSERPSTRRGPSLGLSSAFVPAELGHRAPHDLDPASPRFGPLPPAPPPPAVDELLGEDLPWARDVVHDRLTWAVARLSLDDPSWRQEPPAPVPGPLVGDGQRLRGIWAHGAGPVEGVLVDEPADGAILLLDEADVRALQPGLTAVLARYGGRGAHAAYVATELGVPALFGVGAVDAAVGDRVRLEADGGVTVLERSAPR